MGCDGGTIPRRDELVRVKKKPEQKDKDSELSYRWRHCSITQEPLQEPIVACGLGRLYSKVAVIEGLLDRTLLPECAQHIRSIKDVKDLKLTPNPSFKAAADKGNEYIDRHTSPYICPVIGLEMNGKFRFVLLWGCGCVFSERALKEIKTTTCHKCEAAFVDGDVVILNGAEEDLPKMEGNMEVRQAKLKAEKKAKSEAKQREKTLKKEAQAITSSLSTSASGSSTRAPTSSTSAPTSSTSAPTSSSSAPSSSTSAPTSSTSAPTSSTSAPTSSTSAPTSSSSAPSSSTSAPTSSTSAPASSTSAPSSSTSAPSSSTSAPTSSFSAPSSSTCAPSSSTSAPSSSTCAPSSSTSAPSSSTSAPTSSTTETKNGPLISQETSSIPTPSSSKLVPKASSSKLASNNSKFQPKLNGEKRSATEKLNDPAFKKAKGSYSIASDPTNSEVFKSLFTSHKSHTKQDRAHWVTYNPFYN